MPSTKEDLRKLLVLINRIGTKIGDAIAAAGKATSDAIAENTKATEAAEKQQPPQPPGRITVDIQIPAEEANRYYADKNKNQKLQWATFWTAFGTGIAVAIYAWITYYQLKTMRIALRESQKQTAAAEDSVSAIRRQMRQDQRPWVRTGFPPSSASADPSKPIAKARFESGKPISIPLRIINSGKTPALKISADVLLEVVRRDEKIRFLAEPNSTGPKAATRRTPHNVMAPHIETGIIFPEQFTEATIGRFGIDEKPRALTLPEAVNLIQHQAFVYIYGRIDYSDEFGILHWTKFCRSLSDEPMNPECAEYNDVDHN